MGMVDTIMKCPECFGVMKAERRIKYILFPNDIFPTSIGEAICSCEECHYVAEGEYVRGFWHGLKYALNTKQRIAGE